MKITLKIQNIEEVDKRIDKIITDYCNNKNLNFSRSYIQDTIKSGNLTINGIVINNSNYKTRIDDEIIFEIIEKNETFIKASNIFLDIIYEDGDLAVINKPAGLTTHPGAGNDTDTLANALIGLYGDNLSDMGDFTRRGIVHRLDKDTSGLMVIAKNNEAHISLAQQLEERELKRNYICFMWNTLFPKIGSIELNMDRSKANRLKMEVMEDGRYSKSNYEIKETYFNNSISKAIFSLDTGRTHQIRLHSAYKGCPLIGDKLYGGTSKHLKSIYGDDIKNYIDNFPRQALHSFKIKFFQPSTYKELFFEIGLPKDMIELEKNLKK